MLSHQSYISLTSYLGHLSRFKLGQCDHLIVRVTVADIWRQFQVQGVGRLRLLQSQHARVQIQISEENHIVHHEAEKWPQFILGGQHELLVLIVNDRRYLRLDLARLLKDEVDPWKLFFDLLVKSFILLCV